VKPLEVHIQTMNGVKWKNKMACGTPLISTGSDCSMAHRAYMIHWGNEYIKVETTGQYLEDIGGRWWECIGEGDRPYWIRWVDMIEILEIIS